MTTKLFNGKQYELEKSGLTKREANLHAKKVRCTEWNGYSQLARVNKGILGWNVYSRTNRNVRYDIWNKKGC